MRTYKRIRICGATYFFTVATAERGNTTLLLDHVAELRTAFRTVRQTHAFELEAIVVLPDHLHCLWRLPADDDRFPMRWRLIKSNFSRALPRYESISRSRRRKGERGVWQRRYWEHLIRDELDWRRHLDYIHYNPVKHGYVKRAIEWPYSSFHNFAAKGMYPADWPGAPDDSSPE